MRNGQAAIQDSITISRYELTRNNIRADRVKCVKANVQLLQLNSFIHIEGEVDNAFFAEAERGVLPINLESGDMKITTYFASVNEAHTLIFYYNQLPTYLHSTP
jgi:hypothetical protein